MKITKQENWKCILKRFRRFQRNQKIHCYSIPGKSQTKHSNKAEQILNWWEEIEQSSISLALDYDYVIHTDLTDCYGSLYTHSIAWALHGKQKAKENKRDTSLIGNIIDKSIQNMRYGQTNGIPQGSVLMDFIAEMILGYVDRYLGCKLQCLGIEKYHILRYRDDYRIYTDNHTVGENILKELSVILYEFGFKLNVSKTSFYSGRELVRSAIKTEKLAWNSKPQYYKNLQSDLLAIHQHSMEYPNAGRLYKLLDNFSKRLKSFPKNYSVEPFISITVDIALYSPKLYASCVMVISKLLGHIDNLDDKENILKKIKNKFSKIPNIGFLEIWLQRLTLRIFPDESYNELLCKLVSNQTTIDKIWNFSWIKDEDFREVLLSVKIIDLTIIKQISPIIESKEVNLFDVYP